LQGFVFKRPGGGRSSAARKVLGTVNVQGFVFEERGPPLPSWLRAGSHFSEGENLFFLLVTGNGPVQGFCFPKGQNLLSLTETGRFFEMLRVQGFVFQNSPEQPISFGVLNNRVLFF
jgi:hypothetical protein